ncbi:MAG: NAD(P)-binding protein [Nitrospirota bacterium]
MNKKQRLSEKYKHLLGLDQRITRRDFLGGILLGTGAALLEFPAPLDVLAKMNSWDGYSGVGDYSGSNGNTHEVMEVAHELRNGRYDRLPTNVTDTGEIFDVVVIGGGMAGLGAAFHFKKTKRQSQKCLIIENHRIFGGESKRSEFIVGGHRLIGPQGANSFGVINNIFSELGIPNKFRYQTLSPKLKNLQFDRTNFGFMLWKDAFESSGYFFDYTWIKDIWGKKLEGTPYSAEEKQDFLTWRIQKKKYYRGPDSRFEHWLDTMTYKEYIEKIMGLRSEVTKYADPIMASSIGLGCDVISAYGAYQIAMPGFQDSMQERTYRNDWHSFPGGNDGFTRFLIKKIIPGAIKGRDIFEDILNRPVNFEALDKKGSDIRIRLMALAVRIEHSSMPEKSEYVWVHYVRHGKIYRLKARGIVITSGSWVSRRMIRDLPENYKEALSHFFHSPVLVINVALRNWRFLYKLGLTACRWFHGFGFSCNIRQPMIVGEYSPPLDPDKPIIMTFYVPFYYPGLNIREQGVRGRNELLSKSYSDYELRIREQMVRLFGKAGFDPKKDIAGIILNRWGHAYVNPQPGFYFGSEESPAPRDVIRTRFGRITFGHSELNGHQHWVGALREGRRAAEQVLEIL